MKVLYAIGCWLCVDALLVWGWAHWVALHKERAR